MRLLLSLGLFLFLLSSCSTLNTVVKAKEEGKGTTKIYDVSTDQAWDIAKKSFRWAGSDAIEEYKEDGYMLTSKGMNLVSSGSVMGAWIETAGTDQSKVTVVSKRRISTQIATGMTEGKFHEYFAEGTRIIKSGKKLPSTAPSL